MDVKRETTILYSKVPIYIMNAAPIRAKTAPLATDSEEAAPVAAGGAAASADRPEERAAPEAEGVVVKAEAVGKAEAEAAAEPEALSVWLTLEAALSVGDAPATSLALTVEAEVARLAEASAGKMAWMRISWHCAPIHSS